MAVHVVKPGECFSLIARRYGYADYRALYDHPANADLREKRPNPNVIHPGDEVVIPDRDARVERGLATGAVHTFALTRPKKVLRVVLKDHRGNPLRGEACVLTLAGDEAHLTTDGEGLLECAVPHGESTATLAVAGRVLALRFGDLNPARDAPDGGASGIKSRLKNLGYAVADDRAEAMRTAVALFQHDHGIEASGEVDDATARALVEAHGC
ncbi:MAG: LysM domain-containing protein [Polyangiales bacterium]